MQSIERSQLTIVSELALTFSVNTKSRSAYHLLSIEMVTFHPKNTESSIMTEKTADKVNVDFRQ